MGRAKGSGNVFDSVIKASGIPMPIAPTENVGMMSGPMRKPRGGRRKIDRRGSRGGFGGMIQVTKKDPKTGQLYGGIVKDGVPQFKKPDGSPENIVYAGGPSPIPGVSGHDYLNNPRYRKDRIIRERERQREAIGRRRMPPRNRPLTGGYDPVSGVRYTDTGVPTAVEQTRRVPVQDPTLGGPPEREVPIPRERRQRITRESDPRGRAPFSPDERAMARDRFFERMFDRADERKQQKAMERAERDNVGDALRSERELRESEMAGPGDERRGRRRRGGGRRRRNTDSRFISGEMGSKKRRGGGMRRRRGRRRDFTRRFSRAEGGRRGRSGREMAEFRDRYVSTLR